MPNGVLTSYDIVYTVNSSSSSPTASVMATSAGYIISNLKPQTTITYIIITAYTKIGPGPSAQFLKIFTTLAKPREYIHD